MAAGFIGYKQGRLIRGWVIHQAEPEITGALLLDRFCNLSARKIRKFFLDTVQLHKDKDCPKTLPVTELFGSSKLHVQEDSKFLQDPVFCEYGYVFDLKHPALLLFSGFGDKASRGYQDFSWTNDEGRTYYTNKVLTLTREQTYADKYICMLAAMYRCPRITEILTTSIKVKEIQLWVLERCTSEAPYLTFLDAVKSYIIGKLVPPSKEIPVADLNPLEMPRRVIW